MTTVTSTPQQRRNHERRTPAHPDAETLIRDTMTVFEAAEITRGPSWVSRTVRTFLSAAPAGMPYATWLGARVALNEEQRNAALAARPDLAYVLDHSDPTGETAVRNVMAAGQ